MARFIANLIAWGILFLSMGTLGQITLELVHKAGAAHRTGLISLTALNGHLCEKSVSCQRCRERRKLAP